MYRCKKSHFLFLLLKIAIKSFVYADILKTWQQRRTQVFEGPNDIALARTKQPVVFKPMLVAPVSKTFSFIAIISIIIVIQEEQVCLGPVADQSKGKKVVTAFIQGFGISGELTAAKFVIVIVSVKKEKKNKRQKGSGCFDFVQGFASGSRVS